MLFWQFPCLISAFILKAYLYNNKINPNSWEYPSPAFAGAKRFIQKKMDANFTGAIKERKMSNKFLLYSRWYFVSITFLLIGWVSNSNLYNIHLLSFALSLYFLGFMMIHDFFKESMFSLRLLFNAFGFLYTNFYIIENISNNHIPKDNELYAMELSYIGILAFNIAYGISKRKTTKQQSMLQRTFNIKLFNWGLIVLFVVSLLAEYYVVFYKIGLTLYIGASRSEQSLMRSDYSLFLFYQHTIPLISSVSLFLFLKYKQKLNLLLFILAFITATVSAIVTASRSDMLAIALPILFLCNHYKLLSNKVTILLAAGGFCLFGVWKSLYSDVLEIQYDSEFVSWYKISNNVLSNPHGINYLYGESYFNTLVNLVVPVTGIESLSTWYVRTFEFDVFVLGGGRGFSSVLEAYLNFHIVGVVFIYAFYGWIARKINTRNDLAIIIYMIVLVSINMLFRSEAYAFWKNMMWFRVYPMVIIYLYASHKGNVAFPQKATSVMK